MADPELGVEMAAKLGPGLGRIGRGAAAGVDFGFFGDGAAAMVDESGIVIAGIQVQRVAAVRDVSRPRASAGGGRSKAVVEAVAQAPDLAGAVAATIAARSASVAIES